MMKFLYVHLFIILINTNSIDNLLSSLEIRSTKDIGKYLNLKSELIINDKIYKGNNFQQTKALDSFFDKNDINKFKIIHKGNSEKNLIYILGEYSSNNDIYKVFLTLYNSDKKYIIQKFKIDKKL